jgi:hypothetical protein
MMEAAQERAARWRMEEKNMFDAEEVNGCDLVLGFFFFCG